MAPPGKSGSSRWATAHLAPHCSPATALRREHPSDYASAKIVSTSPPASSSSRTGSCTALELFAGAGFLTLGLARRFDRVTAVEADPIAARDLRHNLGAAQLSHVDVVAARLPEALERPYLAEARPDVAVLDPPRSGLPPGCADLLCELAPRRLVYLSCDPATLARDVRTFADHGYSLEAVEGFDLFPQTPHVEALAVLEGVTPGR
jgi:23S rRNA (uracil1939-C5)-methyltransferase